MKRTTVLLATLAMLVGLLPAVALADDGTIDTVAVTVVNPDGLIITNVSVSTSDEAPAADILAPYVFTMTEQDYHDDPDVADGDETLPPNGTAVAIEVTVGTWTYFFDGVLNESGTTGIAEVTVTLPSNGTLEGDVWGDTNQSSEGETLSAWISDVAVYKDGVKIAEEISGIGSYSVVTGPGQFTVRTNNLYSGLGVNTGDLIDNGEIMWFTESVDAAGATPVTVYAGLATTGVDFVYRNETSGLAPGPDPLSYDHFDTAAPPTAVYFLDMLGNFAEDEAADLADEGLITGCSLVPLNYCPSGDITRAEFAAIIGRNLLGGAVPVVVVGPYLDVDSSYWAAGFIQELKAAGIVAGDGAGNFNPEAPITRAEAAAMLARWSTEIGNHLVVVDVSDPLDGVDPGDVPGGLPTPTLAFIDVPTSYWAAAEISALVSAGVVTGTDAGTFAPEDNLSRAEMAVLVWRLLGLDGWWT